MSNKILPINYEPRDEESYNQVLKRVKGLENQTNNIKTAFSRTLLALGVNSNKRIQELKDLNSCILEINELTIADEEKNDLLKRVSKIFQGMKEFIEGYSQSSKIGKARDRLDNNIKYFQNSLNGSLQRKPQEFEKIPEIASVEPPSFIAHPQSEKKNDPTFNPKVLKKKQILYNPKRSISAFNRNELRFGKREVIIGDFFKETSASTSPATPPSSESESNASEGRIIKGPSLNDNTLSARSGSWDVLSEGRLFRLTSKRLLAQNRENTLKSLSQSIYKRWEFDTQYTGITASVTGGDPAKTDREIEVWNHLQGNSCIALSTEIIRLDSHYLLHLKEQSASNVAELTEKSKYPVPVQKKTCTSHQLALLLFHGTIGLREAHQQHIFHGNVSLENITVHLAAENKFSGKLDHWQEADFSEDSKQSKKSLGKDVYDLALAIDEAFSGERLEDTSKEAKSSSHSNRFLDPERYKNKIRNSRDRENLAQLLERALRGRPEERLSALNFEKRFKKWIEHTFGSSG